MKWISTRPFSLEHAAVLWLVRRFIDPDAVIELVDGGDKVVSVDSDAEVIGPTARIRPLLRKYRVANGGVTKRVESDVRQAQQALRSGQDFTSWAPDLYRIWTSIRDGHATVELIEACFDCHFGMGSDQADARDWATDVLNALPVGTMLIDAAGTVRLANPRMGELVAMSAGRIVGEDIRDIPLEWVDRHGHHVLDFTTLIASAVQQRRRYDQILTRSPRDLFLATSIQPIHAKQQRDMRLVVTCVDATDQVLLEQAAIEREQRVHYLLNTLPFGVMEFTADGEIIYANAGLHSMFNYPVGELMGRPTWFGKPTPVDAASVRERYHQMLESRQQPQPYTSTVSTRTGQEFQVRVDWNYRHDSTGEANGFIATMTDLAENSLRQTEFSRLLRNQTDAAREREG